ncbi:hypothetical protein Dimus_022801 [Dionaea muscipula]
MSSLQPEISSTPIEPYEDYGEYSNDEVGDAEEVRNDEINPKANEQEGDGTSNPTPSVIENNDTFNPLTKKKRPRTSKVWNDFKEIRLRIKQKKQKINFLPSTLVGSGSGMGQVSALHDGVLDMVKIREAAAHWILMHEHPFSILEEEGFNMMMKRGLPQ